jgi:N-acyl-D-amino-acid deacylase
MEEEGSVFDVVIRGGMVADGTGAPLFRADVGLSGGLITAIGPLPGARAETVMDATGRYVFPGLIDTHVHADAAVFDPAVQLAALRQGVTTLLLGQDGLSFAPATPATIDFVTRYFAPVNGAHPHLGDQGVSVADLLATYDRRVPLNTAYLIPHGTIRYEVMGPARRAPSDDDLAAMRAMIERGLADGAAGFSTGLEYAPGRYASAAELALLCEPVASAGLPYVTHMRGYEAAAARGIAEVVEIAGRSGVAAHVSHYHGRAGRLVALVDDARRDGVDLTFDSYPYVRGSSTLAMVMLPDWVPAADFDAALNALADPATARRLEEEWSAGHQDVWPRITLSHVPADDLRWTEGMSLPEAARRAGSEPAAFCRDILLATGLEAGCVFACRSTGNPGTTDQAAGDGEAAAEQSMRTLLRHPAHMAGSDGIYRGGHPHPRGWGTFARLLGRHVRDLGDWTWEQAALHLAGHPARRFRLHGRGLILRGYGADVVVVDPMTVADQATYENPRELALGVEHVIVNGIPVLSGGALTPAGRSAGRALRPGLRGKAEHPAVRDKSTESPRQRASLASKSTPGKGVTDGVAGTQARVA